MRRGRFDCLFQLSLQLSNSNPTSAMSAGLDVSCAGGGKGGKRADAFAGPSGGALRNKVKGVGGDGTAVVLCVGSASVGLISAGKAKGVALAVFRSLLTKKRGMASCGCKSCTVRHSHVYDGPACGASAWADVAGLWH